MKDIIILYAGICLLALTLKYALQFFQRLSGKKTDSASHEHSHDMAHIIKFLILVIIALLLIFSYSRV